MNRFILLVLLALSSSVAVSESLFTQSEIYTPLVNAYQSELLHKYDVLEKCVTPSCTFYTLLDIARLNSKLDEVKAILKEGK